MIFDVGAVFWAVPVNFLGNFVPDRCEILVFHDSHFDDQQEGVTVFRCDTIVQVHSRLLYPTRFSAFESARKQAEAHRARARIEHQDTVRRITEAVKDMQRRLDMQRRRMK